MTKQDVQIPKAFDMSKTPRAIKKVLIYRKRTPEISPKLDRILDVDVDRRTGFRVVPEPLDFPITSLAFTTIVSLQLSSIPPRRETKISSHTVK